MGNQARRPSRISGLMAALLAVVFIWVMAILEWAQYFMKTPPSPRTLTAIAIVATDAALTPSQARRVAVMAHDGFARSLRPVHTPVDGDIVFAVSTGKKPLADPWQFTVGRLGAIAADCLARAVGRGVFEAEPLGRFPSYRAVHAAGFGPK